ncbi:fuconate dehydratase [Actinobacteria bacterium IMCC26103]|nr:fuconate dehydratase [Actinobacteria bacterium IMCC26103]
MAKITGFETFDVRFPTSKMLDGSDAMNQDPDYSGAYLRIKTDSDMHGDSLIFTIGRGNEVQIKALDILAEKVVGLDTADAFDNIGDIARQLSGDSQLRWLGPDYGVFHMGAGGVLNALWDLFAKERKVPLWKLLSDLTPEQVVNAVDFRYITDALNRSQALDILYRQLDYKSSNEAKLRTQGVLAYTTSPGWLGYTDEKMLKLTQKAMDQGFTLLKYKCGKSLEDDKRRLRKVRELVGPDFSIAIDANQVWDVDEAITWINELREFKLRWIEEPTSPTDVVGHAKIAAGVAPTAVATGEMAGSRIIFKQLLQSKGFSVMQIDATRVAGVNENIANILMAAKYSVPVCPHAGGVGLCEMVQHLAMFDAVAVTGHHPGRIVEFVDHLHEHFVVPTDIQNGSYMVPLQPGAGAEMHQASIDKYQFPSGSYWKNGE